MDSLVLLRDAECLIGHISVNNLKFVTQSRPYLELVNLLLSAHEKLKFKQ